MKKQNSIIKKAKALIVIALSILTALSFAACSNGGSDTVWLSPMLSFNTQTNETHKWDSEYTLYRHSALGNIVFRGAGGTDDIAITPEALIAGGAVKASVGVAYGGDKHHLVRIVAFAYTFFNHDRPLRMAHVPQGIMVLWHNPANNQWFNLIQNSIGGAVQTGGVHNDGLVSLRNGSNQLSKIIDGNTNLSFDVFIVPLHAPTREDVYTRSGFVIQLALDTPDLDNHFHGYEILVSSNTAIVITP
ncbi:MAG: hypothetical protein FWB72_07320 [Firmicutes bacterium]|nr:hypothetical protein [Bacillota bacterium]